MATNKEMQEAIYQATLDTLNALSIAFGCVKINEQNGEIFIPTNDAEARKWMLEAKRD